MMKNIVVVKEITRLLVVNRIITFVKKMKMARVLINLMNLKLLKKSRPAQGKLIQVRCHPPHLWTEPRDDTSSLLIAA